MSEDPTLVAYRGVEGGHLFVRLDLARRVAQELVREIEALPQCGPYQRALAGELRAALGPGGLGIL